MRTTPLRRRVALAIAIGLTFWAGVAVVGVRLASDAARTRDVRDLTAYRDQVRDIFRDLYDDVQPMEDAFHLALGQGGDISPARDLLQSNLVLTRVKAAETRLNALQVPTPLRAHAAALSARLADTRAAVATFPSIDHPTEEIANLFLGAAQALDTALYELSVSLTHVLPSHVPPTAGPDESAEHPPLSHASYLVAAGHICGPAHRKLDALPRGKAGDAKADDIIDDTLDDLVAVPLPAADAALLDRTVVTPLDSDPPIAAEGLAAYGSRSCASLLNSINWVDADPTLNA